MCVAPSQNLPPIGCSSVGCCAVGDDDVVPGKLAASPTAINPKSRLACAGEKTSAMNDQNIVVAKRLKTLTQMKNMGARIVRPWAAGIQRMRRKNTKRFAMA